MTRKSADKAAPTLTAPRESCRSPRTLSYTIVNDLGFANILPVGLALYSRVAPRRFEGLVIGIYYLHLFIGNVFVGWLAGFLETMPGREFWGLHAVLVGGAGLLLFAMRFVFGKLLAPEGEAPDPALNGVAA